MHNAANMLPASHDAPRSLSILGATGSIGDSTLDLVRQHSEQFPIIALTAHNNVDKLINLAREFAPQYVVIGNIAQYAKLKEALANTSINVAAGEQALCDVARVPCDVMVAAIVGAAGLPPTMAAIKQGGMVALANKEALVCAGSLVMAACAKHDTTLLPIDSEHNAIFQIVRNAHRAQLDSITLTASGGPFRTTPIDALAHVTPKQAVAHPNWSMGAKISVDSATMMNKALELIEAHHLFALAPDKLKAVIHPESIIHGMAHYRDGSTLAQMGLPDMRTPISYCLAWPERLEHNVKTLALEAIGTLHFEAPDAQRFPALPLAYAAIREGDSAACALNAANEVAVAAFLAGDISYPAITQSVERLLSQNKPTKFTCLDDVMGYDAEIRTLTQGIIERVE